MVQLIKYGFLTVLLIFYTAFSPLFAQSIVSVNEILKSPEHFYNQTIRIKGKVIELRMDEGGEGGIYILRADDTNISITSSILPEFNKGYKITVQVLKGSDDNPVMFREISRTRNTIFKHAGYVLGGFLIVLAAALTFGGSGTITGSN